MCGNLENPRALADLYAAAELTPPSGHSLAQSIFTKWSNMSSRQLGFAIISLILTRFAEFGALGLRSITAQETENAAQIEFFEAKIRPVLVSRCYECHSADSKIVRGGLMLDTRSGSLKGGDSGAAIMPGQPQASLLIQAIRHESTAMPPDSKLSDQVIADFEEWVRNGAVDPRLETKTGKLKPVDWEVAKTHWAFQPVSDPQPPAVARAGGGVGVLAGAGRVQPVRFPRAAGQPGAGFPRTGQ